VRALSVTYSIDAATTVTSDGKPLCPQGSPLRVVEDYFCGGGGQTPPNVSRPIDTDKKDYTGRAQEK
jgi:hypothetical protein